MRGRLPLAAAAFLLLAACRPDTRTPEERGRAAYASYNCRQCHRIGSEGGALGPDLTYVGFRKSEAFLDVWLKDPRGWQQSTQMPNFAYTEQSRKNLVAYLATLKGEAFAGAKPWDAVKGPEPRGAVLYDRLGCGTCHGKGGAGGFRNNNVPGGKIPALRETASTFTREELVRKIKHGVPKPQKADPAGPEPMLAMPAWGSVLTEEEIGALASYLLTLKPADDAGF
ncbi:MAG: c-type cytochrome [Elusimicrobia bacterium]|nr:c-type cytochrome [Elusimicrobiota bacterium]